jgi:hypothetical protein
MAYADDFDLSSLASPVRTAGGDPEDPRARAELAKLIGGAGVIPDTPAAPAAPPASPAPPAAAGPTTPATPSTVTAPAVSGPTPAAVSASGNPDPAAGAAKRALDLLNNAPDPKQEMQQEEQAERQLRADQAVRSQNLRVQPGTYALDKSGNLAPSKDVGRLLPEYRPTVAQRILRGLRGAGVGLAMGGIPGAIRGVAAPDLLPGGRGYGAPNRQGQQEIGRENAAVAADQQSLSEMRNRAKEAMENATGLSREYNAAGRLIKDGEEKGDKTPATVDAFTIQAARQLYPDDIGAQQKYIEEHSAAANKPDKVPSNYAEAVVAANQEQDPNGPMHKAVAQMEKHERSLQPPGSGHTMSKEELWVNAFRREYGRDPSSEEIMSAGVAGAGLPGGAAAKQGPAHTKDRETFETHWQGQFRTMERQYDARKKAISNDSSLGDSERQAQLESVEADREADKQRLQTEKDREAEQYRVYDPQSTPARPAVPPAVAPAAPRSAPAANQPQPESYKTRAGTFTKGQVIQGSDGKNRVVVGFNKATGKLQTQLQ